MPQLRRASAKLQAMGIDLQVQKCLWGYVLVDPKLTNYKTTVYNTPEECIDAAERGVRPAKED